MSGLRHAALGLNNNEIIKIIHFLELKVFARATAFMNILM